MSGHHRGSSLWQKSPGQGGEWHSSLPEPAALVDLQVQEGGGLL